MRVQPLAPFSVFISALIILTACNTTQQEIATQAPLESFTTSAKAEQVRDCLAANANDVRPFQNGWRITRGHGDGTYAFWTVTVTPSTAGTHVETRKASENLSGEYERYVTPCLSKLPR